MKYLTSLLTAGAGTAGLAALREVKKLTGNLRPDERLRTGAQLRRVGCMPSKTLIEAASAFHRRHAFEEFGIRGAASLTIQIPAGAAARAPAPRRLHCQYP